MNRRFTSQGLLSMMLSPEMRGLALYRAGRIALRDADGHPGGPGDDDDADDDSDDDESDDEQDDDADDDESDGDSKSRKKSKDDDDEPMVPARKLEKLQARLAANDKAKGALQKELDRLKSEGVKDEDVKREAAQVKSENERLTTTNAKQAKQIAFLSAKISGIEWKDPADAMALMDFSKLDVEDGKIDPRDMKAAIRDLAKRKPYLLADKPRPAADGEDAEEDRPATGRPANRRRGRSQTTDDAAARARRFPMSSRY